MEWYRILIVIIGALGMLAAVANWFFNGVDVPNGLVTLLSLIISATLGPDAFNKIKNGATKPTTTEEKPAETAATTEPVKEKEPDAGI